ncbi:amino acid permease [Altererythrobacter salegens]|uniref:Arginine/agmatine antiporter n=1 Tax=Croceibacterium salegens TaxID=1737568 RepID=A0A6I4SWC5_9SPHN|nr:amino acid permease [Croceibacterium salegens]MXO59096.1 amino acid permease [Croceibacterium salegens]
MSESGSKRTGQLGLIAATALVMGNMIGSGVYLLPASLAPYGWNAIGGWIVTIGGSLVLAWVVACLTRQVPEAGDLVGCITKAYGKLTAFLVGWIYLVTVWVGVVAVAVAAISYLSNLFPGIETVPFGPAIGALVIVWAITLINLRGVRSAGDFQVLTLAIKLIPLVMVIVIAAALLAGGNAEVAPLQSHEISFSAISGAATLTLFALLGFEVAGVAAERVRNPEVNVPRATMWGTALTGLIYLFVCSAVALMLPQDVATTSAAPLATFVERYWSAGPAALVTVFAIVSCFGAINGWILIQGEMPRAMAEKGELPGWFGVTDAQGTPRRALVTGSVIASVFLLLNGSRSMHGLFDFFLLLTTSGALWFYLVMAMAAWRLKVARPFAVVGVAYSLWTLWGAGLEADLWSFALMLAGLPLYWWTRRDQAARPAA